MSSNSKKQKYIIECLLSDKDIFSRCVSIVKGEYFERNYQRVVDFILNYYNEHNGVPKRKILDIEFDIQFDKNKITRDETKYVCAEIETFCKEAAVKDVILSSNEDIKNENFGAILERMNKAVAISLDHDLGVNFFDNPEEYLKSQVENHTYESTGIKALDKHLGGGILRKQLTLFSANSGGGKSIMLNNIAANFAFKGMNVLYISLELPEDMIYIRSSAIWSNSNIKEWQQNIPAIASKIKRGKEKGGSFLIKRMAQGASVNDIRAYLKHYELEYNFVPDLLIVDYLDLMLPNCGGKGMQVFDKDKATSEQLSELLHNFDMYGLSASQQNRDGIGNSSPDQSIIAGGLSKINTTDNYISLYMDPAMKLVGKMMIYFLKTRSADGVGESEELDFDSKTLAITDVDTNSVFSVMPMPRKKKTSLENVVAIDGVPVDDDSPINFDNSSQSLLDQFVEDINIEEDLKSKKKKNTIKDYIVGVKVDKKKNKKKKQDDTKNIPVINNPTRVKEPTSALLDLMSSMSGELNI